MPSRLRWDDGVFRSSHWYKASKINFRQKQFDSNPVPLNPEDFLYKLNVAEKIEVVTNCDHLADLKFQMRRRLKLHTASASEIVKR